MSNIKYKFRRVFARLRRFMEIDALEMMALLTIFLLLLSPLSVWYLRTPLVILGVLAVTYRPLLKKPSFWYIVATVWGTAVYLNWPTADNHKYLIGYWCLTLCCTCSLPKDCQEEGIRLTSRWLIALCMAFATFWKLYSSDYLDGSFFHHSLLVDERFSLFTRLVGDLASDKLADNNQLWELIRRGYLRGVEIDTAVLASSPHVRWLAMIVTWWTVIVEGILAWLFLLPDRKWTSVLRNTTLLAFVITTYSVAPVKGFAWVLILLAMAQCRPGQWYFRLAFLLVFLLVQVYTIPFGDIFYFIGAARIS